MYQPQTKPNSSVMAFTGGTESSFLLMVRGITMIVKRNIAQRHKQIMNLIMGPFVYPWQAFNTVPHAL